MDITRYKLPAKPEKEDYRLYNIALSGEKNGEVVKLPLGDFVKHIANDKVLNEAVMNLPISEMICCSERAKKAFLKIGYLFSLTYDVSKWEKIEIEWHMHREAVFEEFKTVSIKQLNLKNSIESERLVTIAWQRHIETEDYAAMLDEIEAYRHIIN